MPKYQVSSRIPTAQELVVEVLVESTMAMLDNCTDEEKNLFDRIFPNGLTGLDEDKLKSAYELCRRTIQPNQEKPK